MEPSRPDPETLADRESPAGRARGACPPDRRPARKRTFLYGRSVDGALQIWFAAPAAAPFGGPWTLTYLTSRR